MILDHRSLYGKLEMSGEVPRFYWDSCVILAYLKNEVDKHGESIPHIRKILSDNRAKKNQIIGCQIVRTEVFEYKLSSKAEESFRGFYSYGKNQIWDVDGRIAMLAREIREHYSRHPIILTTAKGKENRRGIKTPDAIHLATAIHNKCDVFHTLDDGGQDGFSLLLLDGNVAGHDLKISKPIAPNFQDEMFEPSEIEASQPELPA